MVRIPKGATMLKPIKPSTDPAYDLLRSERQPLSAFFAPQTVALVGATEKEGSVGRTLIVEFD
jgi:acetyltransferase